MLLTCQILDKLQPYATSNSLSISCER